MIHEFIVSKGFVRCELHLDGLVTITPLPPYKYGERTAEVLAKAQELIITNLLLRQKHTNVVDVALDYFNGSGWQIEAVSK
jgi:hypothetical protein